jgi:hypothetical protein
MNDEDQALRAPSWKPVVVHAGLPFIEDLVRHVDPAPDDEIERFVAAIYADRCEAATNSPERC